MKILKFLTVFVAVLGMTFSVPAAALAAPGKPGAVVPTNGLLIAYPTITIPFQWSSVGTLNTIYYDVEISTDGTFTDFSKIVDSNDAAHTLSNCAIPNMAPFYTSSYAYHAATTYYWRVQAYDTTCNGDFTTGGSGWNVFSFRMTITAPAGLNIVNGSTLLTPTFEWTSQLDASGYILQVSTSALFTSTVLNLTVTSSNVSPPTCPALTICYLPPSDLPSHTTLFWRVEALNSTYGPSAWSYYPSFTTANVSAAPVPINIGPSKVTNDFNPGLRWNEIALPSGATFTTYTVQVSTDQNFTDASKLCFSVDNTSAGLGYLGYQTYNNDVNNTFAQLDTQTALAVGPVPAGCPTATWKSHLAFKPVTQYYWRVRATVSSPGAATSDWSKVYTFKTSYPKVDSTTFATTTDATYQTITFSWTDISPKPYAYWIQACFDANFSEGQCIMAEKPAKNPFKWTMPNKNGPSPGITLYWRVASLGPWGPSLWSDYGTVVTP